MAYNGCVTVFYCRKCGAQLTPQLAALPTVPELPDESERDRATGLLASTVPRGHYAIETEPWGPPYVPHPDVRGTTMPRWGATIVQGVPLRSAGPQGNAVIHPEDCPDLLPLPHGENGMGCCGPRGDQGRNRMCPCGSRLATLLADCWGPHELHLDALRVYAYDEEETS